MDTDCTRRHADDSGHAVVLRAQGIVKRFPGFRLGPIDLDIHIGRIYGLLGTNGAGKTTLLSCLAQQSHTNAGELRVDTRRATWNDYTHREVVAFVREVPVLYESLSARQHVRLASWLFARWDGALADHWLDVFRIDQQKRVRHFSKGMRVKLALILALAHRPRLLLLDEPMNGIDIESRFELQELLRDIAANGRAGVLVSSHVFQDVEALATDLVIIRDGLIVFTSRCDTLSTLATWTLPATGHMHVPPSHVPLRAWTDRRGRRLLTRGSAPIPEAPPTDIVRRASLEDVYFAFARGTDDVRMAADQSIAD